MALKYRSTEVFLRPDVRHKSKLVAKFINCLMYGGKKSTAESVLLQGARHRGGESRRAWTR